MQGANGPSAERHAGRVVRDRGKRHYAHAQRRRAERLASSACQYWAGEYAA